MSQFIVERDGWCVACKKNPTQCPTHRNEFYKECIPFLDLLNSTTNIVGMTGKDYICYKDTNKETHQLQPDFTLKKVEVVKDIKNITMAHINEYVSENINKILSVSTSSDPIKIPMFYFVRDDIDTVFDIFIHYYQKVLYKGRSVGSDTYIEYEILLLAKKNKKQTLTEKENENFEKLDKLMKDLDSSPITLNNLFRYNGQNNFIGMSKKFNILNAALSGEFFFELFHILNKKFPDNEFEMIKKNLNPYTEKLDAMEKLFDYLNKIEPYKKYALKRPYGKPLILPTSTTTSEPIPPEQLDATEIEDIIKNKRKEEYVKEFSNVVKKFETPAKDTTKSVDKVSSVDKLTSDIIFIKRVLDHISKYIPDFTNLFLTSYLIYRINEKYISGTWGFSYLYVLDYIKSNPIKNEIYYDDPYADDALGKYYRKIYPIIYTYQEVSFEGEKYGNCMENTLFQYLKILFWDNNALKYDLDRIKHLVNDDKIVDDKSNSDIITNFFQNIGKENDGNFIIEWVKYVTTIARGNDASQFLKSNKNPKLNKELDPTLNNLMIFVKSIFKTKIIYKGDGENTDQKILDNIVREIQKDSYRTNVTIRSSNTIDTIHIPMHVVFTMELEHTVHAKFKGEVESSGSINIFEVFNDTFGTLKDAIETFNIRTHDSKGIISDLKNKIESLDYKNTYDILTIRWGEFKVEDTNQTFIMAIKNFESTNETLKNTIKPLKDAFKTFKDTFYTFKYIGTDTVEKALFDTLKNNLGTVKKALNDFGDTTNALRETYIKKINEQFNEKNNFWFLYKDMKAYVCSNVWRYTDFKSWIDSISEDKLSVHYYNMFSDGVHIFSDIITSTVLEKKIYTRWDPKLWRYTNIWIRVIRNDKKLNAYKKFVIGVIENWDENIVAKWNENIEILNVIMTSDAHIIKLYYDKIAEKFAENEVMLTLILNPKSSSFPLNRINSNNFWNVIYNNGKGIYKYMTANNWFVIFKRSDEISKECLEFLSQVIRKWDTEYIDNNINYTPISSGYWYKNHRLFGHLIRNKILCDKYLDEYLKQNKNLPDYGINTLLDSIDIINFVKYARSVNFWKEVKDTKVYKKWESKRWMVFFEHPLCDESYKFFSSVVNEWDPEVLISKKIWYMDDRIMPVINKKINDPKGRIYFNTLVTNDKDPDTISKIFTFDDNTLILFLSDFKESEEVYKVFIGLVSQDGDFSKKTIPKLIRFGNRLFWGVIANKIASNTSFENRNIDFFVALTNQCSIESIIKLIENNKFWERMSTIPYPNKNVDLNVGSNIWVNIFEKLQNIGDKINIQMLQTFLSPENINTTIKIPADYRFWNGFKNIFNAHKQHIDKTVADRIEKIIKEKNPTQYGGRKNTLSTPLRQYMANKRYYLSIVK
jgi:hypothetical protein